MQQTPLHIHEIFKSIQSDNREAFNRLFREKYASLVGFAKNYLFDTGKAEEVVSDVFVAIWTKRDRLHAVENPETYLYVAVKNRCLNALRATTNTVSMNEYYEKDTVVSENPLSEMEQKELSQKLHAVINALPEQQRLIFNMIKENGLTAKQTADILQLSPRTVETHIYKAIKQLEKEITAYLGYSPKKRQMGKILAVCF